MARVWVIFLACVAMTTSEPCDESACKLPKCRCYDDKTPPGNLQVSETPQIIMVSMFGTLNSESVEYYTPIFKNYENPNGCPVRGTFFVQDQGTDYSLLRNFYDQGHEIGIHSLNGSSPTTSSEWIQMYKSISGLGLLYDSSCTSVRLSSPNTMIWPYTLDYDGPSCDSGSSPGLPFPGRWEVPVADLYDLTPDKVPCVVPSACRNVTTKKDAYDILFNAFKAHYEYQKTPFNLIVDPVWAKNTDFREATIEFLQYVRTAFGDNVWIVPIYKTLEWIQHPTPIANLSNFKPWGC